MITILKTARRLRNYLVYDLEWVPGTLQLRMVGVYDGDRYRWYRSIVAFLRCELTSKNRGKWFYAHAGGLADFQFILERLAKIAVAQGYKIRGSFSGSSAIIVHVTRGKNSWHFIDSFWLLKESLREIGKWIGIAKGNEDESVEFYANAPLSELRDYNEVDCLILYRAIEQFETVLLDLGGQLKMTQASCAMELFRRRFLKASIETSYHVNQIARHAYFASRVEVFQREAFDAFYYDVNSSFPYAMTMPIPGELIGTYHKRLPERGLFLADVTIRVPESYLPPMPFRTAGRIFFPTGEWRGWYTNVDLRLLLGNGGQILAVHESLAFEPIDDLRGYAETLFALRRDAEGFTKVAYKYLLNSLYGKFAESSYKSGFVINPPEPKEHWIMLFPGAFVFEQQVPVPHMHVPISVHITAIARRTLYQYMGWSSQVHYCDTDGFSSADAFAMDSKELGDLKLEKVQADDEVWQFIAAKIYRLGDRVKAKGFSLGKDPTLAIERWEQIQQGDEIEYARMRRIKELLRSGQVAPREDRIRKKLSPNAISKRCFYPDGQSRPWSIEELEDLK